jgi:hypothetical protein
MAFTLSQPSYGQGGSYTAQQDRLLVKANAVTGGVRNLPSQIDGTSAMQGDLAITVGTNSTVNIAAGDVWIPSTSGQGFYYAYNDASVASAAFGSNSSGNSRIDIVTVQVTDPGTSAPSVAIAIVAGTPAASPTPPATPSLAIALARVTIPTGFVSGTTAVVATNIVDVRPKAQLNDFSVPNTSNVAAPVIGNVIHDGSAWNLKSYNSLTLLGTSTTSLAVGTGSKAFTTQTGLSFATGQRIRAISSSSYQNYVAGNTTSTTSLTVGTGSKTLTVGTNLNYVVNTRVRIYNTTTPGNYMEGAITAYTASSGSLTVNVDATGGSGTIAVWTVAPTVVSMEGVFASYAAGVLTITVDTTVGAGTFTDWLIYAPSWEQPVKSSLTGAYDGTYRYVPTAVSPSTVSPPLPFKGSMWYQTDTTRLLEHDGSAWQRISYNNSTGRTGCSVTATAFSIASGASSRNITYDAETFDSDGFFTPSGTNITIPTGLGGLYALSLTITWDTDPGASTWTLIRCLSGSTNYAWRSDTTLFRSAFGTTDYFTGVSAIVPLAAGDVLSCSCTQSSGVAININSLFTAYRVGL